MLFKFQSQIEKLCHVMFNFYIRILGKTTSHFNIEKLNMMGVNE